MDSEQTSTSALQHGTGSESLTNGIFVRVSPSYLAAQSDPAAGRFLFSYHVMIRNEGVVGARLCSRQWIIVDGEGNRHDVNGMGVVGHYPDLAPGESFEYSSFCPLPPSWGTMEGSYIMEQHEGGVFEAVVNRFFLVSPAC